MEHFIAKLKSYAPEYIQTKVKSIGDGLWILEVYGSTFDGGTGEYHDEFLFDLVGSNGTRSESADLYGEFQHLMKVAHG